MHFYTRACTHVCILPKYMSIHVCMQDYHHEQLYRHSAHPARRLMLPDGKGGTEAPVLGDWDAE